MANKSKVITAGLYLLMPARSIKTYIPGERLMNLNDRIDIEALKPLRQFDHDLPLVPRHFRQMPSGRWLHFRQSNNVKYPSYRAAKRDHINIFKSDGIIRIGTVWDFRKSEYGERIGDSSEGARGYYINTNHGRQFAGNANQDQYCLCLSNKLSLDIFAKDEYDGYFTINSPEYFWEIACALDEKYPIDGCDVHPVFYLNDKQLKKFAQQKYNALSRYGLPIQMFPPSIIKPYRYHEQNEIRALFRVKNDPLAGQYPDINIGQREFAKILAMKTLLKPLFVKASKATQYITIC